MLTNDLGKILRGDHTFAIAKVPTSKYERIYDALYCLMNEYGQIIGFWMTFSKNMEELRPHMEKV